MKLTIFLKTILLIKVKICVALCRVKYEFVKVYRTVGWWDFFSILSTHAQNHSVTPVRP